MAANTLVETLPLLGEAAPWTRDATADAAAHRRILVGRAPLPGEPRSRVLEAVPAFTFSQCPSRISAERARACMMTERMRSIGEDRERAAKLM